MLVLGCLISNGQTPDMNRGGSSGGSRSGSDSQKKQKAVKTKNDSIVFKLHEYQLLEDLTRIQEVKVDTSILDFHML